MLVEHSAGWLFEQMVLLETDPEKWWKQGAVGIGDDDPDHDPAFDGIDLPPAGWESLPMYDPEGV